jgi:hypothetical protein
MSDVGAVFVVWFELCYERRSGCRIFMLTKTSGGQSTLEQQHIATQQTPPLLLTSILQTIQQTTPLLYRTINLHVPCLSG